MIRGLFIAGGGFFGSKALHEASNYTSIVVADVDKNCLASRHVELVVPLEGLSKEHFKSLKSILVVGDSSSVLSKAILLGFKPSLVIPAIPRHFAADFLKHELEKQGFKVMPSPNIMKASLKSFPRDLMVNLSFKNSMFTCSYMPSWSKCLIPCTQPDTCPVTGGSKPKPMIKIVEEALRFTDLALTLESKRIGDYSGGFEFEVLWNFINKVKIEATRRNVIVSIATACKCHGVANFFKVVK